jgi:signal transduction histidine kinase
MQVQQQPSFEEDAGRLPGKSCWVESALSAVGAIAWTWDAATGRIGPTFAVPGQREGGPGTLDDLEQLIHHEDRASWRAVQRRAFERGEAWTCSYRLAGANAGEARWMEERGRVWLDAAGQPARAVAVAIDDPRGKPAGADVRGREPTADVAAIGRPEPFLESIFTSMADGLVLVAPDGRIAQMNPRAQEVLGFTEGAVPATLDALHDWVRPVGDDGQPMPHEQLPLVRALRGDSVRGLPLPLRFSDGRSAWVLAGAAPVRAPGGEIAGAVLTLADVTRMRELQEHREDLARMISHDLRTPLGIILAQAKLLGRRADSPEALRGRVDAIATSAQRMSAMLSDLVESALLEAGKLRLDLDFVDVGAMVNDLRRRLAAPYDGERIRVESAHDLPLVLADPNRLERVFLNLLTNALKYSQPGTEVVVRVTGGDAHVVAEVEDHGQGIAPQDIPHLFERYFRVLGTHRFDGMGLGLYTARMLVEAHGGTIGASSVPGRGSVFRVRLPMRPPGT